MKTASGSHRANGIRAAFAAWSQFAVVKSVAGVGVTSDYQLHHKPKGQWEDIRPVRKESELAADAPPPAGRICLDQRNSERVKIINSTMHTPSDGSLSHFQCLVSTPNGGTRTVNSACLMDPQEIYQSGSRDDFQGALSNTTPLVYMSEDMKSDKGALAYRGDTREPGSKIFRAGFEPWESGVSPVVRTLGTDGTDGKKPQFDLDPRSGVCASHLFQVGCMFPLLKAPESQPSALQMEQERLRAKREQEQTKGVSSSQPEAGPKDSTYLYVFIAVGHFDTYQVQEQMASVDQYAQYRDMIISLSKGKELCVGREGVFPDYILCGVHLERHWNTKYWQDGCRFKFGQFYENTLNAFANRGWYRSVVNAVRTRRTVGMDNNLRRFASRARAWGRVLPAHALPTSTIGWY